MHELGVTFHIMDHLEKVAEESSAGTWGGLDGDRVLPAELLDVGGEETAAV